MIRIYHNPWLLGATTLGSLLTGMAAYSLLSRTDVVPIPSRGGEAIHGLLLGDDRIYLQTDPRWRNALLGGSGELFGATGCTICCVSMALSHFGIEVEPGRLNEVLKSNDGFLGNGWLLWSAIPEITGDRFVVDAPTQPDYRTIDTSLKAGHPVLARVLLGSYASHWVLIVGKEGYEYLIKDPLGRGDSIDRLSVYRSGIHAIRIIRPNPDRG